MPSDAAGLRFPFHSPHPLEPPREHATLRATQPVAKAILPGGAPVWLVTRYEDVRKVFTDPRLSRQAITAPDALKIFPVAVPGLKTIAVMDPPEHTRIRKLVAKTFTMRQMERLRPRVEELAEQMISKLAAEGPPADLIAHVAEPLPITVICELLGVPQQARPQFLDWTDVMFGYTARPVEEIRAASTKLRAYFAELVANKQQQPADDLLTMLITARDEDNSLSTEELLTFGETMLLAGHHSTTAAIAHAVLNLASQPGQTARLAAHPELLPAAIEELLRFATAGSGISSIRIATEEIELGGVTIRPGEAVLPCLNSANHDENVFDQPEQLRLDRKHNPHLAFGHGIHHCIGAHLARVELQVVLERLMHHLGEFDLAIAVDELSWRTGITFFWPHILPLRW
ncbi:MAG: cytochrome P450 [Pseudonocardiaceae bacterium]